MMPNYRELRSYLAKQGIDANQVPQDNLGPDGFDEYVTDGSGRRLWDSRNRFRVVRKPWPSPEVYENVCVLLTGGTLEPEVEPEPAPEVKEQTEEVPKAKTPRKVKPKATAPDPEPEQGGAE